MKRFPPVAGPTILAVFAGLVLGCMSTAPPATPTPTAGPPLNALDAARRAAGKGDCEGAKTHLAVARQENPKDSAVVALSQWVEAGCHQDLPQVRRTVSPTSTAAPVATDPGFEVAPPAPGGA